jgi:hypothetical protein
MTVLNAAALPDESVDPPITLVCGSNADSPSLLWRIVRVAFPSSAAAGTVRSDPMRAVEARAIADTEPIRMDVPSHGVEGTFKSSLVNGTSQLMDIHVNNLLLQGGSTNAR